MNGRNATIVVLMLAFIAACFFTDAAVSGEHPWDADVLVGELNWDRYDIANTETRGGSSGDTVKPDTTLTDTSSTPDGAPSTNVPELVQVAFGWMQLLLLY